MHAKPPLLQTQTKEPQGIAGNGEPVCGETLVDTIIRALRERARLNYGKPVWSDLDREIL